MKRTLFTIFSIFSINCCFSQQLSTLFKDENSGLAKTAGTVVVNDPNANGGSCLYRSAASDNNSKPILNNRK